MKVFWSPIYLLVKPKKQKKKFRKGVLIPDKYV